MSQRTILGVVHEMPLFDLPAGACDSHVHVFGPHARFELDPARKYTPGEATVDDLCALHRTLGIKRVVVVQPNPYLFDNRCLMAALDQLGADARGVVAIDADATDDELSFMHAAGVRGVRLNLEARGLRDPDDACRQLRQLAARVAPWGWHVQVFATLPVFASLCDEIAGGGLPPIVVDHFALAPATDGPPIPALETVLARVREGSVWVKLSSPQRISDNPDAAAVTRLARAFIDANPDRMLWGTDWPHPGPWPCVTRDPTVVEPFHGFDDGRALNRLVHWAQTPDTVQRILVDNPARLYDFPTPSAVTRETTAISS